MKAFLLAAASVVALATAASAADLPSRRTAPAVVPTVPVFTWTGLYAGASVGYLGTWDKMSGPASQTLNSNGAIFGGDIGYNWQTGALVFGVEADLAYATNSGSATVGTTTQSTKINGLGTVRGRIGYAVDRALIYVTGGYAYANIRDRAVTATNSYTVSGWDSGWTLGGGVEYAVSPNWTVRAEGLYVGFGSGSVGAYKFKDSAVVARVGVNYKF